MWQGRETHLMRIQLAEHYGNGLDGIDTQLCFGKAERRLGREAYGLMCVVKSAAFASECAHLATAQLNGRRATRVVERMALQNAELSGGRVYADNFWSCETYSEQITAVNIDAPTQRQ
eukprot:6201786-Pleurochrysis_carterae.AAC.2